MGQKKAILIFSTLKFPVLYLAGFFILKSRFFSVPGILIGITVFLAAFGWAWMSGGFSEKNLKAMTS